MGKAGIRGEVSTLRLPKTLPLLAGAIPSRGVSSATGVSSSSGAGLDSSVVGDPVWEVVVGLMDLRLLELL